MVFGGCACFEPGAGCFVLVCWVGPEDWADFVDVVAGCFEECSCVFVAGEDGFVGGECGFDEVGVFFYCFTLVVCEGEVV